MLKVKHYFDDPDLKNAMKRLLCVHAAPADLRERVGKIVCPGYAAGRGRAIALCITAGVVVLASVATWVSNPPTVAGEVDLSQTIAESLIRTHDACCRDANHHLLPGIAPYDIGAAGATLADQLQVPVIAAALPEWNFVGAGPCPVWGHKSAHLLYRDGVRRLSVFTLPSDDFALGETGDFSMTINDHHLSGFLRGRALYCVVEDSPDNSFTEKQADHLRDQLRDDFTPTFARSDDLTPTQPDIAAVSSPSQPEFQISPPQLSLFPARLIAYHPNP